MVKVYQINLDSSPEKRWAEVLNDYNENFTRIIQEIDTFLARTGYNIFMASAINAAIIFYQKNIMYYDEIAAISQKVGISMDKLITMQLLYELSAACTTVVTEVDGHKVMFRTMDWEMPFLKDITIEVEYISQGKPRFRGTTWVGYVGILTGMNIEHQYSVAINYRRTKSMNIRNLVDNIVSTLKMNWPVGHLIRDTLEKNFSFNQARERFIQCPLISPTYITLCHTDGSCILVRNSSELHKEIKGMPLIQTNVDDDKTEPNIIYSNERREVCSSLLTTTNLTIVDICKGLEKFPVFNDETIYCNIIVPTIGYYATSVETFTQIKSSKAIFTV